MTRDDIVRMAREAGFTVVDGDDPQCWAGDHAADDESLERFFTLAYEAGATAERDRMIADGWRQCAQGQKTSQHCALVEQARLEEREACARVCAEYDDDGGAGEAWAGRFAAAIRARGTPDPRVVHLNEWARDRLARHGISIPEDDHDGNPSF